MQLIGALMVTVFSPKNQTRVKCGLKAFHFLNIIIRKKQTRAIGLPELCSQCSGERRGNCGEFSRQKYKDSYSSLSCLYYSLSTAKLTSEDTESDQTRITAAGLESSKDDKSTCCTYIGNHSFTCVLPQQIRME